MTSALFNAYVHWQYVSGPKWLTQLYLNIQQMLWRLFSVSFMVRTLFAPWRRDVVSYRGLSLDRVITAFAWNGISRGAGFVIRVIVLGVWLVSQALALGAGAVVIILFLLWPLLIVLSVATGLALLITGG